VLNAVRKRFDVAARFIARLSPSKCQSDWLQILSAIGN